MSNIGALRVAMLGPTISIEGHVRVFSTRLVRKGPADRELGRSRRHATKRFAVQFLSGLLIGRNPTWTILQLFKIHGSFGGVVGWVLVSLLFCNGIYGGGQQHMPTANILSIQLSNVFAT